MKHLTDEEIEKGGYDTANNKDRYIWFSNGAKWYREQMELQMRNAMQQKGVDYEENVQDEKEIPYKPITEQAYDGSEIQHHHEYPVDWRGVDMKKLWGEAAPERYATAGKIHFGVDTEQQKMKDSAYEKHKIWDEVNKRVDYGTGEIEKGNWPGYGNTHLREVALKMSGELNPNVVTQAGLGQYGSNTVAPKLEKVLEDAEKIYEWLSQSSNSVKK